MAFVNITRNFHLLQWNKRNSKLWHQRICNFSQEQVFLYVRQESSIIDMKHEGNYGKSINN